MTVLAAAVAAVRSGSDDGAAVDGPFTGPSGVDQSQLSDEELIDLYCSTVRAYPEVVDYIMSFSHGPAFGEPMFLSTRHEQDRMVWAFLVVWEFASTEVSQAAYSNFIRLADAPDRATVTADREANRLMAQAYQEDLRQTCVDWVGTPAERLSMPFPYRESGGPILPPP